MAELKKAYLEKLNYSGKKVNVFFLLDPGHGGWLVDDKHPKGHYPTPGKRSPEYDGKVFYEGVHNREIVKLILEKAEANGIDVIDIVNSEQDVPLGERTRRANEIGREIDCVYVSIHHNAAGMSGWHPASGISVYTSKGQTKSDVFAEIVISELVNQFDDTVRFRFNETDGDRDHEADFWVLRNTSMPAVLLELGFMTNKEEVRRMETKEWKEKCADAVVEAMIIWNEINE